MDGVGKLVERSRDLLSFPPLQCIALMRKSTVRLNKRSFEADVLPQLGYHLSILLSLDLCDDMSSDVWMTSALNFVRGE